MARGTDKGNPVTTKRVVTWAVSIERYVAMKATLNRLHHQGLVDVDHSRMTEAVFLVNLTEAGIDKYRELGNDLL
jgi:hypothetical protein